jgi:hypothetical protein
MARVRVRVRLTPVWWRRYVGMLGCELIVFAYFAGLIRIDHAVNGASTLGHWVATSAKVQIL